MNQAAPELLPCPFCWGRPREYELAHYGFMVGCIDSKCAAYNMGAHASKWNTRAAQPPTPNHAELEAAIETAMISDNWNLLCRKKGQAKLILESARAHLAGQS